MAGKLAYGLQSPPATVHDLLLERSDGVFELVVWDENWSGGTDTVTVDLSVPRASVAVLDPTVGSSPVQTLTNASSVSLTISDHPVVLEIVR